MTMAKRMKANPRRRKKAPARFGMPSKDSVREVVMKTARTGLRFRILKTTEKNSYDKPQLKKRKAR